MSIVQQVQEFLRSIFLWWVTISPWQQGVRVRFGKNVKLLHPGIHFKMPIFDVVYMQPIRVRAQHIHNQTLTTMDGKTVSLAAALQYEISDLLLVYQSLHNAHDMVEQKVQSAVAQVIVNQNLKDLSPADVEKSAEAMIDLSEYGLSVRGFSITSFAVVKTYRLINGEFGSFTAYGDRFETMLALGETNR